MPSTEQEEVSQALGEFVETDHYRIAQVAKPIILQMQSLMPIKISWEGITYGILSNGATRVVAQITFFKGDPNKPVRIRVTPVYLDFDLQEDLHRSLVHELAHLGAMRWKGYAESGHGFYWGYLMIAMGYEPSRCITTEESITLHRAKVAYTKPQVIFEDCAVCKMAQIFNMDPKDFKYHCESCGGVNHGK